MLKAKQHLLYHNTNNLLLHIRQFEVDYFQNMYNTFGVLGAVVSGFAVNSIAQVVADTAPVHYVWKALFWLWTTCAIGFSTHVMVTTALITVYGPGLALRGPIGSMKKAVDGMYYEQRLILFSTVAAIFCLSMELLTIFVIEMYIEEAWVCSIFFITAMFFWYNACLRIYNNFKIPEMQDTCVRESWMPSKGEAMVARDDAKYVPPSADVMRTKVGSAGEAGAGHGSGSAHGSAHSSAHVTEALHGVRDHKAAVGNINQAEERKAIRRKSGMSAVGVTDKGTSTTGRRKSAVDGPSPLQGRDQLSSDVDGEEGPDPAPRQSLVNYCEGYLIMQVKEPPHTLAGSALKFLTQSSDWDRKYFVLNGHSLWYYMDRETYEKDSDKPCILRPILVQYYHCVATAKGISAVNPPYELQLVPNSGMITAAGMSAKMHAGKNGHLFKKWVFRCDTFAEMKDWIDALTEAGTIAIENVDDETVNPLQGTTKKGNTAS